MMTKQDMVMQNDTYTLLGIISGVIVFSGWILVGILAAFVMMALTPPQTRLQVFGMGAAAFASSFFVGPLVIEAYGFSHYSFQAQLGICFMCAAPAWTIWSIVSVVLKKWRDSKNPVDAIGKDIKKIKKWF
jgi:predicted permease